MRKSPKIASYLSSVVIGVGLALAAPAVKAGVFKSENDPNGQVTSFYVHNYLEQPAQVYWADFEGQLKPYGTVAPGQGWSVQSGTRHAWVIYVNGQEYMRYRLDRRQQQYVTLGKTAIGTIQPGTGSVEFLPISQYKEFQIPGHNQKASISLTIKPKLYVGADRGKYLLVDLDGSIVSASSPSGVLMGDTQFKRGWYLESVRTTIRPATSDIALTKAANISTGDESGNVTSSTSTTVNVAGSGMAGTGDKGPSAGIGGNIGLAYTVGNNYTRNLLGFKVSTPSVALVDGAPAVSNDYALASVLSKGNGGLIPYTQPKDIVDYEGADDFLGGVGAVFTTKAWQTFRLHGVPDRAKQGLPLISQALFNAKSPGYGNYMPVVVDVTATLRNMWVTGETKLDGKWHSQSYNISTSASFYVDFNFNYEAR